MNKLGALRGPGESYSDVIIRLFVGRDADEATDELLRIIDPGMTPKGGPI